MAEKLDLKNVIEIERIRNILSPHSDLLSLFELLINVANQKINDEKPSYGPPLEINEEPELSDHESDDDDDEKIV